MSEAVSPISANPPDRRQVLDGLRQADPARLETLWRRADQTRRAVVGNAVHLRGLIEISNHCVRHCHYCGISSLRPGLQRYRMTRPEILEAARRAAEFGYGTVVMQSGEDDGITAEWLADIIRRIKQQTPLAVTLSMGERPDADLAAWREAGADRYLLRFETSDPELYRRIHPARPQQRLHRIELLGTLRRLGYEVGSGVMVGIPGQSYESLATDIELFGQYDLDMVGLGPFIADPATPLGQQSAKPALPPDQQVPATGEMVCKVLALTRLVCPEANIPSTTGLATIDPKAGRASGLQRGANVVMPNLTPERYRRLYAIYPQKAGSNETIQQTHQRLLENLAALGRPPGRGRGDRRRAAGHP